MNNIKNQDSIKQWNNNSQHSLRQTSVDTKTKIITKIFITLLVYLGLFFLIVSIFFIFIHIQYEGNNFSDTIQVIFELGISGVFTFLWDSQILFFFPFMPVVITLLIIFTIVNILEKWTIITRNKKILLKIFIMSIILFSSVIIFDIIKQIQDEKRRSCYKGACSEEETYETPTLTELQDIPQENIQSWSFQN